MAVTITASALASAADIDAATAGRLLPVATALALRFAPDAPDDIANEAVIRTAGWLAEQPAASLRSWAIGDIRAEWTPSMTGALRHSGAMSLLSPWKVRRAGAIG